MNLRIALMAFPLIAVAQPSTQPPPPEVDQALRARATAFFECYVDGNFRKAFEMVAEDTKDLYFGSAKTRVASFKLGDIKYFDNFTRAEVTVKAGRDVFVLGERIPTELSEVEKFKIEDGKWVWYDLPTGDIITPSSVGHVDPAAPGAQAPLVSQFPDLSPEGLRASAAKILGQISVDKSEIVLAVDVASEAKVVLHNGMGGPVQLKLAAFGEVPGFSARLDKTQVGAADNAALLVRYDPSLRPADQKPPTLPLELRMVISPTSQAFAVTVRFMTAR